LCLRTFSVSLATALSTSLFLSRSVALVAHPARLWDILLFMCFQKIPRTVREQYILLACPTHHAAPSVQWEVYQFFRLSLRSRILTKSSWTSHQIVTAWE
jgi:hypothetical protein